MSNTKDLNDESANHITRLIVAERDHARRCSEWNEREQSKAKRREEWLCAMSAGKIAAFAVDKLEREGGRRKSFALPAGTIGFRTIAPNLVVDDESAVLSWARVSRPDLIKVTEHLDKAGLNEHFETTGELPDAGVRLQPAQEKFYIK